jgi:hypothetical protein
MAADILTCISILVMMLIMRNLVSIFPSLAACLVRAKECINLEASVKLSRSRDIMAVAMILPFCLILNRFGIYGSGFIGGLQEDIRIAAIIGLFLLYLIMRIAVFKLFRPQRMPGKTYTTEGKAAHTFFVILTLVLLVTGGAMTVSGADESSIKSAMLWLSAGIYGLFFIRKFQIFTSNCSIFTAFLYLCALEIIPTGIIVVSAIIL